MAGMLGTSAARAAKVTRRRCSAGRATGGGKYGYEDPTPAPAEEQRKHPECKPNALPMSVRQDQPAPASLEVSRRLVRQRGWTRLIHQHSFRLSAGRILPARPMHSCLVISHCLVAE